MIDQICLSDVLLNAAKEVFETMILMDIELSPEPSVPEKDALLSSITFKGDIEGCLAICCSQSCAKTIASNMLGMESSEAVAEQEWVDAMGEVANMVMGSVKSRLQDTTPNIEVSIPAVVSGQDLKANLGDRMTRTMIAVKVGGRYSADLSVLHRSRP
jgi:CheY-specific phosphatase CheX